MFHTPKRLFVGRPLRSDRLGETLLPKRLALPVFCSDPLSSVAYATEQILLVLGLGGLGDAVPDPVAGAGASSRCWSSWSPPTGRPATPIRTAAAPTRSAGENLGVRAEPGRGQRAAGRLRADRRGLGGRRRRGDHLGRSRRWCRTRSSLSLAFVVAADGGEPARGEGVRPRVRRAHLRLRRDRPAPARRRRGAAGARARP